MTERIAELHSYWMEKLKRNKLDEDGDTIVGENIRLILEGCITSVAE